MCRRGPVPAQRELRQHGELAPNNSLRQTIPEPNISLTIGANSTNTRLSRTAVRPSHNVQKTALQPGRRARFPGLRTSRPSLTTS